MSGPFLSVRRIDRKLWNGSTEALEFEDGVNVLVGVPNTGKTKWLQTLDFLLGDSGTNPFENSSDPTLAEKYDAASTLLLVGGEQFLVERRWKEAGAKTKLFVNGGVISPSDFQFLLMERLNIPLLHFPKGTPCLDRHGPSLVFVCCFVTSTGNNGFGGTWRTSSHGWSNMPAFCSFSVWLNGSLQLSTAA